MVYLGKYTLYTELHTHLSVCRIKIAKFAFYFKFATIPQRAFSC